jgi:hypothetical protein
MRKGRLTRVRPRARGRIAWSPPGTLRKAGQQVGSGGRRPRCTPRRDVIVRVKFTAAEKATLDQAAARAALSLAAYLGQAGMDAAEHRAAPVTEIQREALAELIRAAELVRRAGVNLNQAVARLNATGQPGPDLGPAADYCARIVGRIDQAAERISRGLRSGRTRPRAG